MWLRKLFAIVSVCVLSSGLAFTQDTRDKIISNQELIISICQRLTESLDLRENILKAESESLKLDRQALTQERKDFETYKQSTQANEMDLQKLRASLKKQSEQLANLNRLVSIGVPVAAAIIIAEAVVIAFK
jgi:septal ring factor EnvC (AmiA/AmiB activator)